MEPRKPGYVQVNVRLPRELRRAMRVYAATTGVSGEALVERALREFLERHGVKQI